MKVEKDGESMGFRGVGATDVGLVRKENQDSYLLLPEQEVYVIADGMGGYAGGKQASAIAVDTFRTRLASGGVMEQKRIEEAVAEANHRILEEAQRNHWDGMGTTFVLAWLSEGLWKVAHIGDSRAYVIGENSMYALTRDHSLVEELVANGSISKEEAKTHPHRNVLTKALGTFPTIQAEWGSVPAEFIGYLLLCTDGLYNMLDEEILYQTVTDKNLSIEDKVALLIGEANQQGGTDNITVILLEKEVSG